MRTWHNIAAARAFLAVQHVENTATPTDYANFEAVLISQVDPG